MSKGHANVDRIGIENALMPGCPRQGLDCDGVLFQSFSVIDKESGRDICKNDFL